MPSGEAAIPMHAAAPAPPVHVAIIMDGNRRWAQARGLPVAAGHQRGAQAARRVIEAATEQGIRWLTLFGFSSENWNRPEDEVQDLMGLLRWYLRNEIRRLADNGVRLSVIGDRARLASDIRELIAHAEQVTAGNRRLELTVALSYGSRQEILAAARAVAEAAAAGRLDPAALDEAQFSRFLFTAGMPDPDLIIRSSGEKRLSNFLLWQGAYAELVFVDALWPDFTGQHLAEAVAEFHRRERRYGARPA